MVSQVSLLIVLSFLIDTVASVSETDLFCFCQLFTMRLSLIICKSLLAYFCHGAAVQRSVSATGSVSTIYRHGKTSTESVIPVTIPQQPITTTLKEDEASGIITTTFSPVPLTTYIRYMDVAASKQGSTAPISTCHTFTIQYPSYTVRSGTTSGSITRTALVVTPTPILYSAMCASKTLGRPSSDAAAPTRSCHTFTISFPSYTEQRKTTSGSVTRTAVVVITPTPMPYSAGCVGTELNRPSSSIVAPSPKNTNPDSGLLVPTASNNPTEQVSGTTSSEDDATTESAEPCSPSCGVETSATPAATSSSAVPPLMSYQLDNTQWRTS